MADNAHLREAYAAMRAAFPRWANAQNAESLRIWGDMLRDIPGEKLVESVQLLARSSRFHPSPAEIREAAGCEDPEKAKRREASARAAAEHRRWVADQERRATAEARSRLAEQGIDPDSIKPASVTELTKGIG